MTRGRIPVRRFSRALVLLVLMATGFGVLAGLLAAPAQTPTPSGSPSPGTPLPIFTFVSVFVVVLVFGFIAWQVFLRFREGRLPIPGRAALSGVVAILVAIAFVFVIAALHPGGLLRGGGNGTNQSTGPPNASSPPTSGGGLFGGGGHPVPGLPQLTWTYLVLIGLGIGAVLAIAVFLLGRESNADASSADTGTARQLRAELEGTLRSLESDPDADPRERIRALYHRLLLTLRPRVGRLAEQTAREIENEIVETFRVDRPPAHALTLLFEEARYSTHPLGRPEVERARVALSGILEGLERWRTEGPIEPSASGPTVIGPPAA